MRQIFVQFLKFAFATGIITYFIRSGKIDLQSLMLLATAPGLIAALFLLQLVNVGMNNLRWQILLDGQGIKKSFWQCIPLTFIGLFFNIAIPGAVGGDVIKALYVAREHSSSRAKAVMSVGMDRLIGLFSFVALAVIAGLSNWEKMVSIPQLKVLLIFVLALFTCFIAFFAFCFSQWIREHHWMDKFLNIVPAREIVVKLYDAVYAYRSSKRQFIAGILLSLLAQTLYIVLYYMIARQIGQEQTWGALFFVVPLGLITMAIPISPAGVGVGQVAFHQLFLWYLGQDSTVGATAITVLQAVGIIMGLLGAPFYFTRKAPSMETKGEVSA